jgi:hypothetical protein
MKQTSNTNTGGQIHFLQQHLFCEGKIHGTLMREFKNDISKRDARFMSSVHLWTSKMSKVPTLSFNKVDLQPACNCCSVNTARQSTVSM